MCCILIAKSKRPSFEILSKVGDCNRDGAGVMWFEDNMAVYKKGLNVDEVHELIGQLKLPYTIHFRLASIAGKDKLLTHPFEISEDSPLKLEGRAEKLLAHNGHFSNWDIALSASGIEVDSKELMSDTRAIAIVISRHKNYNFLDKIPGYFVVADSTTKTFYMSGHFTEEDGILYSNLNWKHRVWTWNGHMNDFSDDYDMRGWNHRTPYMPGVIHKAGNSTPQGLTTFVPPVPAKPLSRRERRAIKKQLRQQYNQALFIKNASPRIHEEAPETPFKMAENTQKILGLV